MSDIEQLIPRTGLQCWYEADGVTGVADGGNVATCPDKSTHARDVVCASSYPTFETNIINGLPAINWSGSQNPLNIEDPFDAQHIIVIAAYADAAFPVSGGAGEYAGLISGIENTGVPLLFGDPTTSKFFDLSYETYGDYEYRLRGVQYAESVQPAPMSGNIAVIDVRFPVVLSLAGIQWGRDRKNTNRKWKGPGVALFAWDHVLAEFQVRNVYEYAATKYHLWQRNAAGLDIWPFQPNWARPLAVDKPVLSSISVDRSRKSRSKGSAKKGVQLQFENRSPEEYNAAVAFWDAKYPGTSFIYRDLGFSPARDTEMVFTAGIAQQSADTRDITYTIQAEEV